MKTELLEKPDVSAPESEKKRFKSTFGGVSRSSPVTNTVVVRKNMDYQYYVLHKGRMLLNVNKLGEGASFGDVALTSNKPRNATIVAGKDCYFGILDKATFDRTIGEHKNRESEAKLQILKNLPIFCTFTDKEINTIIPEINSVKFRYRDTIIKAGKAQSSLYIVRSGKVRVDYFHQKVTKKMDNHNTVFLNRSRDISIINSGENKEQRYIDVAHS